VTTLPDSFEELFQAWWDSQIKIRNHKKA